MYTIHTNNLKMKNKTVIITSSKDNNLRPIENSNLFIKILDVTKDDINIDKISNFINKNGIKTILWTTNLQSFYIKHPDKENPKNKENAKKYSKNLIDSLKEKFAFKIYPNEYNVSEETQQKLNTEVSKPVEKINLKKLNDILFNENILVQSSEPITTTSVAPTQVQEQIS